MFCNQCQETAKNQGCAIRGVCGKTEDTSNLQDLLVYVCQGLSYLTIEARKKNIDTNAQDKHIVNCLFMTITNANFDNSTIIQAVEACLSYRENLKSQLDLTEQHDSVHWQAVSDQEYLKKARQVGIQAYDQNEDVRSLKQ